MEDKVTNAVSEAMANLKTMSEDEVRKIIREELAHFMTQSKFLFSRPIQVQDGNDVVFGQNNGTRFGTSTTQKIGFLGVTPRVVWPTIPHPNVNTAAYVQADVESLRSAVESLMDIAKNFGFLAP